MMVRTSPPDLQESMQRFQTRKLRWATCFVVRFGITSLSDECCHLPNRKSITEGWYNTCVFSFVNAGNEASGCFFFFFFFFFFAIVNKVYHLLRRRHEWLFFIGDSNLCYIVRVHFFFLVCKAAGKRNLQWHSLKRHGAEISVTTNLLVSVGSG